MRVFRNDLVRDEVFSYRVGLDDGFDQGLRDVPVVCEQLLGVLGQAVAAVAKGRVIIVASDTRVHADAVNDLLRVEALGLSVGVELVEVGDTNREVGIGKELDRLGLGRMNDQGLDVLRGLACALFLDAGTLEQEVCEHLRGFHLVVVRTDDNAARMEVVIECLGLSEELRAEDDVINAVFLAYGVGVADRDGGLDDHHDIGVDLQHVLDRVLDCGGVEEVVDVVVVGGRRNDNEVGARVGCVLISRSDQVELAGAFVHLAEETLDLFVLDRADELVELFRLGFGGGDGGDFVFLGEQDSQAEADISDACDGYLHRWDLLWYIAFNAVVRIGDQVHDIKMKDFRKGDELIYGRGEGLLFQAGKQCTVDPRRVGKLLLGEVQRLAAGSDGIC